MLQKSFSPHCCSHTHQNCGPWSPVHEDYLSHIAALNVDGFGPGHARHPLAKVHAFDSLSRNCRLTRWQTRGRCGHECTCSSLEYHQRLACTFTYRPHILDRPT